MKLEIKTTKRYGEYLSKHLQKEHPMTKGKIRLKWGIVIIVTYHS